MNSLAVAAAALLVAGLPFDRYPGQEMLSGKPAAPQVDTPRARRYRTVLREEAKRGPNFNGHYRVIHWGCGTNCIEWAVADLSNGKVWFAAEPANSCFPPDEAADTKVPDWFDIRLTSRLLALHHCAAAARGRTFDTRSLYEWQNGAMRLVVTEPTGR